jgi:UDP-N-acetylmuramoylalanine--D-glutamate ligase
MTVAIIGYGLEGQSALHYWQNRGADVTICDRQTDIVVPQGIKSQLGDGYLHDLNRFDVIMRSAGIMPEVILADNPTIGSKITTVVNEFLRVSPTKNIIGITGTKGKGTTCTLTTQMLEAAGYQVFLGGNIGVSPFDFLDQLTPDSWVVLELSSFQLTDISHGTKIAVCLMVVPEHLNWHADMQDYMQAKSNLFAHQQTSDTAIYFANSPESHTIASHSPGAKITYYAPPGAYVENDQIVIDNQHICNVNDLQLLGSHNWQNACAAATAVWQVVQAPDAIRKVLTTFSGLPHRLEFVRDFDEVSYYDDSFATTPEAAIVALQAIDQPKVIILGGADKGVQFDELAKAVREHNVRHVVAIGATGPVIAAELRAGGFTDITEGPATMADIVAAAKAAAKPGDAVLLSTGCASFGIFKDYKDRGNQFKQVVTGLG